jgi:hypothetical protein
MSTVDSTTKSPSPQVSGVQDIVVKDGRGKMISGSQVHGPNPLNNFRTAQKISGVYVWFLERFFSLHVTAAQVRVTLHFIAHILILEDSSTTSWLRRYLWMFGTDPTERRRVLLCF